MIPTWTNAHSVLIVTRPLHQPINVVRPQLKSKYDKFISECERTIAFGLRAAKKNEAKIEEALVRFRLDWDFETWQREQPRYAIWQEDISVR